MNFFIAINYKDYILILIPSALGQYPGLGLKKY